MFLKWSIGKPHTGIFKSLNPVSPHVPLVSPAQSLKIFGLSRIHCFICSFDTFAFPVRSIPHTEQNGSPGPFQLLAGWAGHRPQAPGVSLLPAGAGDLQNGLVDIGISEMRIGL
jgi:hypothetical protein